MMGFHIVNNENKVVGWTYDWFEPMVDLRLIPDVESSPPNTETAEIRGRKIAEVKEEAARLIAASQWRVDRAKERDSIGAPGETLTEVYIEREAIRRASNRAEKELEKLDDVTAIGSYVFSVKKEDHPDPGRITRLAFVRRFKSKERRALATLRAKDAALDDWWSMLELANLIDLNDPQIKEGIYYLELKELLEKGRAAEILRKNDGADDPLKEDNQS